jgi:hypothetical protein
MDALDNPDRSSLSILESWSWVRRLGDGYAAATLGATLSVYVWVLSVRERQR